MPYQQKDFQGSAPKDFFGVTTKSVLALHGSLNLYFRDGPGDNLIYETRRPKPERDRAGNCFICCMVLIVLLFVTALAIAIYFISFHEKDEGKREVILYKFMN